MLKLEKALSSVVNPSNADEMNFESVESSPVELEGRRADERRKGVSPLMNKNQSFSPAIKQQ